MLILLLFAILLIGFGTALHRYVLREEESISYAFLFTMLSAFFLIPMIFLEELSLPKDLNAWLFFFLAAFIWFSLNIVGFLAIKYTDISLNVPLKNVRVFFLLFLSVFFLAETLTMHKLFGTLVIFFGASILVWKKGSMKGVQLTILAAFLDAMVNLLDKMNMFVFGFSPAFYGFTMFLLPGILLSSMVDMKSLNMIIKRKGKPILLVGLIYAVLYYLVLIIYKSVEVSIVYPLLQTSILVAIAFGYLWLKEKEEIGKRIIGAVLMIIGTIFIMQAI